MLKRILVVYLNKGGYTISVMSLFAYGIGVICVTLCYVIIVGLLCLAVFFIGAIAAMPLPSKFFGSYLHRMGQWGLFVSLFLTISTMFSLLWTCTVWNHLYYSTDYCGTDFLPFWPISTLVLTNTMGSEHGELIGINFTELQVIWALFTAATWGATIYAYYLVRQWFARSRLLPNLGGPQVAMS